MLKHTYTSTFHQDFLQLIFQQGPQAPLKTTYAFPLDILASFHTKFSHNHNIAYTYTYHKSGKFEGHQVWQFDNEHKLMDI